MPPADLYLLRLQWLPYLTPEECRAAGAEGCEDFLARLQNQSLRLKDCPGLSTRKRYALQLALQGAELVPPVEAMALPQPTRPGLFEINAPGPLAPILVSGNSEITLAVLSAVLATTISPFYLLLVDTLGDTLDMAMIYERFTPAKVTAALQEAQLAEKVQHHSLIIPGLAAALEQPLAAATGWEIRVGPICALEMPLYFGEYWQPPMVN
jgi:CO dehydrogenase/acetyl-CoA synthase gamma subunit (corrinoid Fe-S protein)